MTAFLTAEWRHLLMLNYAVDPALLEPLVPRGTRLDAWQGRTYVSVVGFLFLRTRLLGVPVPFHTRFEEVNLRFYVARDAPEGTRRGVAFVKELVPKRAVAAVAHWVYDEPYVALPMRHTVDLESPVAERAASVQYRWRFGDRWHSVRGRVSAAPESPRPGSEAEFITEHYWGYTALPDGRTREYHVVHPPWKVRPVDAPELDCDVGLLYGERFVESLSRAPDSALLADGSAVEVHFGRIL